MDKKWRIRKRGNEHWEQYVLQKRLLGFLWWYNPDNIDGAITGCYDTLAEAKEAYKRKTSPIKTEFIDV